MSPDTKARMFGFTILAVIATLIAMNTTSGVFRSIASEQWPHASAQVIASTVYEDSTDVSPRWEPSVVYHYKVGDRTFTSGRVRFLMHPMYRREEANQVADSYQVGRVVSVAYDPANPSESVLEPGPPPGTSKQVGILLALILITAFIYYEIHHPERRVLLRGIHSRTYRPEP